MAAALALTASACGGGGSGAATPKKTTTTTLAATTTTVAVPVAPLTGLTDPGGASLTRPALSVKVENTAPARPQAGIDQADVLYEEVVEGGITRFVAVFNSTVPDVIGPVRSVRQEDPDIVWPLGGIFAYSGGAPVNVEAINAAPVHTVDENNDEVLVRNEPNQPPRDAPHNLYGLGPGLFALGGDPKPPTALFEYLPQGSPAVTGRNILSFHVGFDAGYDPTWTFDGATDTWQRSLGGSPSMVTGPGHIAPANVVVQFTPYTGEGEARTVGEGDVWIFTDGTVRPGRWVRPDRTQPAHYVDAAGQPILLRPGRTWVELLPADRTVDLTDAPPPATTVPPVTAAPAKATNQKKK